VHSVKPPRVTVFIPTYNRARFLPSAIESVLAQTYTDFRLEISDNASTDETPEVVASYDDPRIVSTRQPENIGMLANHARAFARVAETEYALVLSDDDAVHPELLASAIALLDAHPRVGTVHTSFDLIGEENEILQEHVNWTNGLTDDVIESSPRFIEESMRWSCRICASTAVMRTAAFPPDRMRQDDFPAIDLGLWLRMAAGGWEFAFVAETLGDYRIHGGSHSAAFGDPTGPGYMQRQEIVSQLKGVKLRFVDEHADRLEDPERLRHLAEGARRRELVLMARNLTLPERRAVPTFRALAGAARSDPGVLLETSAWKLAAASLLGRRVVDRLKERRAA
jgi:glycosyltransferase involved in cell wall biosynthesis